MKNDGEFVLPRAVAPASLPIITEEHARDLAMAWIRTWRPWIQRDEERERGAKIDWSNLRPGRTFFAQTPYGPVPDRYHPAHQRMFGPFYVVLIMDGDDLVLIASVSAYNQETRIDEKREIQRPVQSGEEVVLSTVPIAPRNGRGYVPVLPEQAAARFGRLTGARTAHVPELVQQGATNELYLPSYSLWRLRLDREVALRGPGENGRRLRTREVFAGPNDRYYVPAPAQPQQVQLVARLRQEPSDPLMSEALTVPLVAPLVYEQVIPDAEGG